MKDAWFVALCAIALFNIIEAKPGYRGHYMERGGNDRGGSYDTNGNSDNGYGGKGNGDIRGGYGSATYGYGQNSGRGTRYSSEETDFWSFLKPCSGSGCISIGNGYRNTNIIDIASK